MKKSLLTMLAATGMALVQGPANAEGVNLYGLIDAFGGVYQPSGTQRAAVIDNGGLTRSFWGMRGSEKLTNDLEAIFVLESFFQADTGAVGRFDGDAFFARASYVGLAGKFGEFRLGRSSNPSYFLTNIFDPFNGSTKLSPVTLQLWTPTHGRLFLGDTSWSNSLAYESPTFGGFTVRANYGLGEQAGTNGANNAVAMVLYENGQFSAAVSGQKTKYGSGFVAGIADQKAVIAGASYDFKVVKAFASYAYANGSGIASQRSDTWQIGATVPIGAGKIMASWARSDIKAERNGAETQRDTAAIGYDYNFSKRTDVYAVYLYDKIHGNTASGNSFGLGMRHRF